VSEAGRCIVTAQTYPAICAGCVLRDTDCGGTPAACREEVLAEEAAKASRYGDDYTDEMAREDKGDREDHRRREEGRG
jgi:hypothetical protein